MKKIIQQSLIAMTLLATASIADEVAVSDVEAQYSAKSTMVASDKLKQSLNLGFSNTSGNTDTTNINAKYTMSFTTLGYADKKLKVSFDTSAFVNKSDKITSNEEYTANLGLEQYVFGDWLGYAAINWLRNPDFKNLDNKIALGAGIGKVIYRDKSQTLQIKIGTAYNIQQYANNIEDAKFVSINEYLEYNKLLNKTSGLYVKIGAMQNVEDFSNDYEVLLVGGLTFSVAENISVTIEEEILYDKIHPGTKNDTDTKSIIRVGYNF